MAIHVFCDRYLVIIPRFVHRVRERSLQVHLYASGAVSGELQQRRAAGVCGIPILAHSSHGQVSKRRREAAQRQVAVLAITARCQWFLDDDGTCWKTPYDHDRADLFIEIHRAYAHARGQAKVFFIGLADKGLSDARHNDSFAVFSWSKNARHVGDGRERDILFPVYPGRNTAALIDEACERNIDYSSVHNSERVFGRQTRRCGGRDEKQTMYDGTGPPASCQREYYAALARDHKDQMDFRLIGKGQTGNRVDFEEFYTNHTFHLSTDGFGADGSAYLLMAHANVVFRAKSQYKMALDDYMTPWKHYVPVMSRSMDDVLYKHRFLLQRPGLVKKIRWHARSLACRYLTQTAREKFWRTVGSAAEIPAAAAQSLREQRSLYFVPCNHT